MGNEIQVDPQKVIDGLLRQVAEQSAKIAVLEAYISQSQEQPDDSGDK